MLTDATPGGPMMSPAAKMPAVVVWKSRSTWMRPPGVGLHPRLGQAEPLHVADPPDGVDYHIGTGMPPVHHHLQPSAVPPHGIHLGTGHELHPGATQDPREARRDLRVEHRKETLPSVHQGYSNTEGGEDRGILGANRAATHHHHFRWQPLHRQYGLGIMDVRVLDRYLRWVQRVGAGGDQDHPSSQNPLIAVVISHYHGQIGPKPPLTRDHLRPGGAGGSPAARWPCWPSRRASDAEGGPWPAPARAGSRCLRSRGGPTRTGIWRCPGAP